jgi:hypothetical protein
VRNLAKLCAIVALCLVVAGGVQAADHPRHASGRARMGGRPRPGPGAFSRRPVAAVAVPQTPLSFGRVGGAGPLRVKAQTAAHVAANCPYRLMASFQGFVGGAAERTALPPKLTKVTINGKEVPVGTEFVEIATGGPTPPGGVDVPITIEIKTSGALTYPAGQYGGDLAITVRGG